MPCASVPPTKPPLTHRIGDYLFGNHDVVGVKVCVLHDDQEIVLEKVTGALQLLSEHDPAALRRLRRDLTGGIRINHILQNSAQFNSRSFSCQLEFGSVISKMPAEELALTLVHEATHARLWRLGVGYEEPLRARIEQICMRRELAVARKLPNGQDWADWVERSIKSLDDQFLTEQAFSARERKFRWRILRHIRELGMPKWFVRSLAITSMILRKVSGFLRAS